MERPQISESSLLLGRPRLSQSAEQCMEMAGTFFSSSSFSLISNRTHGLFSWSVTWCGVMFWICAQQLALWGAGGHSAAWSFKTDAVLQVWGLRTRFHRCMFHYGIHLQQQLKLLNVHFLHSWLALTCAAAEKGTLFLVRTHLTCNFWWTLVFFYLKGCKV